MSSISHIFLEKKSEKNDALNHSYITGCEVIIFTQVKKKI